VSERTGFTVHKVKQVSNGVMSIFIEKYLRMSNAPIKAIESGLSLFIIASALVVYEVPVDFAISSFIMLLLLLIVIVTGVLGYQLYRLILFTTIGFSVYLLTTYPVAWLSNQIDIVFVYFIVMTLLGFITVKMLSKQEFNITPLDYLVIVIAVLIEVLPGENAFRQNIIWMIIQLIILFYVCELLIQQMQSRINRFTGTVALALALIAYRGLT
jgi:hypothetical protein